MGTLLLRNAYAIATFDDSSRELRDASILIRENAIAQIGPEANSARADEVIDCSRMVLLPGLVNTHHHFYQTLTRAVRGAQDTALFEWLTCLYPMWARLTPEAIGVATQIAICELLLSGCTTSADHGYVWPNGSRVDDQIEAARELGFRFHASRGSMSLGQSQGGLPPDSLVENEDAILEDTQRVIDQYHDPKRFAMTRIVVAPCSPFSVSENLMRESIALARENKIHAHTHLAETLDEERFCLERFGCRPIELAERWDWVGPDVWHAHVVHASDGECERLGATRTGIAHCATSNMRLGSGIAPVGLQIAAGARVGLGVDGSASNDSSNMLDEARHALLLQRVANPDLVALINARDALRLATWGGAQVLGRDDIGSLAPGMAADIAGWSVDSLELSGGALHDPIASLIFCRPGRADLTIVNGRVLVRNGELLGIDLPRVIALHNELARRLISA